MKLFYWLTGYRARATYWSHSKLAKYILKLAGMERAPNAATIKEWDEFKRRQIKKNPLVFFITDVLFDEIQNCIFFPVDVMRNISYLFNNRVLNRTSILDTKLSKYEYHTADTRVLYGLCELIVDMVEVGEYGRGLSRRGRTLGIEHLDWEISLGDQSPVQSKNAAEIKEIYLWWVDVRPQREDAMDKSGWSKHADKIGGYDGNESDAEKQKTSAILKNMADIENEYSNEDSDMLIRIIKIMHFAR